MMYSNKTQKTISMLIFLIAFLITIPNIVISKEKPSTLTGHLINENGEPILDSTVVLFM